MKNFAVIVEEIRKWDEDRLTELESIVQRQLILKKRKAISKNYRSARKEEKAGKLSFTSGIKKLRQSREEMK